MRKRTKTTRYICFPARKGGVGKTMLAGNTAAMLASEGYKVLLFGADSQEDISERYLADVEDFDIDDHITVLDVLSGIDVHEGIVSTPEFRKYTYRLNGKQVQRKAENETYHFDILPAGKNIDELNSDSLFIFREILAPVEDEYDFVIFDTPASETDAVMFAFMASDYAVVPVTYMASFKSVQMVLDNIRLAGDNGSSITCLGVVVNDQHASRSLDKFNEKEFRDMLGNLVFKTVIRDASVFVNADAFNIPVCSFPVKTAGTDDIYRFYVELKKRMGVR